MVFYVRLLTYQQACSVIAEMKRIGGDGQINIKKIVLYGTQVQFDKIITHMDNRNYRYEISV